MGQKVHPIGMRVGVIRDWDAKWYAEKEYAEYLHEDLRIRKFIASKLADAAVSTVEIERAANRVNVSIHTAKPGMVIGKGGAEVENLRKELNKLTGKRVHINIVEIKKPDLDAKLVGEGIARQLENRVAFRRAQKQAIQRTMRSGAKGIKTQVSGRLNGADIARSEGYSEGTVPLHTLRADIDYAWEEADTTYGKLGVKVWIYRGEVLPTKKNTEKGEIIMKFPVVGAGAMGLRFGVLLQEAGNEVDFVEGFNMLMTKINNIKVNCPWSPMNEPASMKIPIFTLKD